MANFPVPEAPRWLNEVRQFETSDPAHADLFNAVVARIVENLEYLYQNRGGGVLIGPAETPLKTGETLFVVEGTLPQKFSAAAFGNVVFGASPPQAENWGETQLLSALKKNGRVDGITVGKLAVTKEQDAPADTVFLAKINP